MYELNSSMNQSKIEEKTESESKKPVSKPNERAGFAVFGHVKIFDPNSKEVMVEIRA